MFNKGSGAKEWGSLCEGCPREAQQAVGICDQRGCIRFSSDFDGIRKVMIYRMDCPHCKMMTSVYIEDGVKCSGCGMSSSKAHQAHVKSGESKAIQALSGPILDDMGPVVGEDYEDDDD